MTNWKHTYEQWLAYDHLDADLRNELNRLQGYPHELEDAFYQDLTFGTGGMRGMIGPGTNRMNIYTIRKAVYGLANDMLAQGRNVKERGVVVAYDPRYQSQTFAIEAAKVLGSFGIKTYVFNSLRPTPLLSFAVRHLQTAAGIMITASHNPPEYNGFKMYNEHGGQMVPAEADQVIAEVQKVKDPFQLPFMEQDELEDQQLLHWLGTEIDQAYLKQLSQMTQLDAPLHKQPKEIGIVFTPLHGTSEYLVIEGLKQLHFTNVHVVEEQAIPDPEFSTVHSPNPEEHQAFDMAMERGKEVHADILLATDPDSDRLGVAVRNDQKEYQVLTGNQLGVLLLDYILSHTDFSNTQHARLIKSIVTTEMGSAIARDYQTETIEVLTGFKYIGEEIQTFTSTGETFIFGFEESYGYLMSSFVRDKDAVQAAVMACEMAYHWQQQGKTLLEALECLYEKYGYYKEGMSSLTLKGREGNAKITALMESTRENHLTTVGGLNVEKIEDYLSSERTILHTGKVEKIDLPKENVLKFLLENNSWVCLRPSGTEPKVKCYYGVCEDTNEKSEAMLAALKEDMEALMASV